MSLLMPTKMSKPKPYNIKHTDAENEPFSQQTFDHVNSAEGNNISFRFRFYLGVSVCQHGWTHWTNVQLTWQDGIHKNTMKHTQKKIIKLLGRIHVTVHALLFAMALHSLIFSIQIPLLCIWYIIMVYFSGTDLHASAWGRNRNQVPPPWGDHIFRDLKPGPLKQCACSLCTRAHS